MGCIPSKTQVERIAPATSISVVSNGGTRPASRESTTAIYEEEEEEEGITANRPGTSRGLKGTNKIFSTAYEIPSDVDGPQSSLKSRTVTLNSGSVRKGPKKYPRHLSGNSSPLPTSKLKP